MTYRPSWHRSRLTSSAQHELKTAPCHTIKVSFASWLATFIYANAISVASGEVATEQCSAANEFQLLHTGYYAALPKTLHGGR